MRTLHHRRPKDPRSTTSRALLVAVYFDDSLHSAVVELVALPGSRITYPHSEWSNNVYNLVTKRARAEAEAQRRVDSMAKSGRGFTMKYRRST